MAISIPFEERASNDVLPRSRDAWSESIASVRHMISISIGCMKELKTQAFEKYNAPGMRIAIGEIISSLGNASRFLNISEHIENVEI